ncbi:hypothetical protein B0T22DRAFT_271690 [Podospora appendiculata]|uniref:Uncharacterized protein n=1 Tax=Podospora appendiculata TaxID=314037 RepID=A0AAE1C9M4_9PEZI|nr:hypothetical protein B0T22DRAFT_271690 [Podospora appendiculata]
MWLGRFFHAAFCSIPCTLVGFDGDHQTGQGTGKEGTHLGRFIGFLSERYGAELGLRLAWRLTAEYVFACLLVRCSVLLCIFRRLRRLGSFWDSGWPMRDSDRQTDRQTTAQPRF